MDSKRAGSDASYYITGRHIKAKKIEHDFEESTIKTQESIKNYLNHEIRQYEVSHIPTNLLYAIIKCLKSLSDPIRTPELRETISKAFTFLKSSSLNNELISATLVETVTFTVNPHVWKEVIQKINFSADDVYAMKNIASTNEFELWEFLTNSNPKYLSELIKIKCLQDESLLIDHPLRKQLKELATKYLKSKKDILSFMDANRAPEFFPNIYYIIANINQLEYDDKFAIYACICSVFYKQLNDYAEQASARPWSLEFPDRNKTRITIDKFQTYISKFISLVFLDPDWEWGLRALRPSLFTSTKLLDKSDNEISNEFFYSVDPNVTKSLLKRHPEYWRYYLSKSNLSTFLSYNQDIWENWFLHTDNTENILPKENYEVVDYLKKSLRYKLLTILMIYNRQDTLLSLVSRDTLIIILEYFMEVSSKKFYFYVNVKRSKDGDNSIPKKEEENQIKTLIRLA